MQDYFYIHDNLPRLTVVIYYQLNENRPKSGPGITPQKRQKQSSSDDPKLLLDSGNIPLYNHLRDWRNELAKQKAVPPYIIASNQQLALMVKQKPQSLAQLAKIEGFGQAKVKQYGQLILDQLSLPIKSDTPANSQANPTSEKQSNDSTTP